MARRVPWGVLQAEGVPIVPARQVPTYLQALPPMLGPERVAWLADRARLRFHAAAWTACTNTSTSTHAGELHLRLLGALTLSISGAPALCSS